MLTIFAIPKALEGHSHIIQRNALKSWTLPGAPKAEHASEHMRATGLARLV